MPGEIAVLTPYVAQLQKLRDRLSSSFEIVLNDRDMDELEKVEDPTAGKTTHEPASEKVAKTSLARAIRCATVDNFQGEEAKVVVISLVRCNDQRNCGFLRTSNRINVLLSRAMHGMYILGNAQTSKHINMWDQVLLQLEGQQCLGRTLELCCPRHEEVEIKVINPEDFMLHSPEGGCQLPCAWKLKCGHSCVQQCHSDLRHNAVRCLKECTRPQRGCGKSLQPLNLIESLLTRDTDHVCPLPCGDPCPNKCMTIMEGTTMTLKCGHVQKNPRCWEMQSPETLVCRVKVDRHIKECGHTVMVECNRDVISDYFQCTAPCAGQLSCGHDCRSHYSQRNCVC